jgi:hypothetical protein
MFYTSFKQDEIYNNRQTAIDKSRKLAKKEFLDIMFNAGKLALDEYGNFDGFVSDIDAIRHETIVQAYEAYLINRSTVYEVRITKIDKVF